MIQIGDIVAIASYDRDILGVITAQYARDSWQVSWLGGEICYYRTDEIYWLKEHWNLLTSLGLQAKI